MEVSRDEDIVCMRMSERGGDRRARRPCVVQGGDLLVQKDRLEPGSWKLDFECEPDNEE